MLIWLYTILVLKGVQVIVLFQQLKSKDASFVTKAYNKDGCTNFKLENYLWKKKMDNQRASVVLVILSSNWLILVQALSHNFVTNGPICSKLQVCTHFGSTLQVQLDGKKISSPLYMKWLSSETFSTPYDINAFTKQLSYSWYILECCTTPSPQLSIKF